MSRTNQPWTPVESILKALDSVAQGKERQKVGILGAGMAGLAAAYELKKRGHQVEILEGSERVGGRVWTHRFDNGQYGEYGAMRIPGQHDYTRHYIQEADLELGRFITSNPLGFYDVRGTITRIFEALDNLYPQYKNLRKSDKALASEIGENGYPKGVGAILDNLISPIVRDLSQEDRLALYSGQLTDKLKKLDAKALRHFLREERPSPDGAMELIGSLTSLENLWQGSLLEELRGTIEGRSSGLQEIIGGMDRLPNCLADQLIEGRGTVREDIQFRTEVLGITTREDGVELVVGEQPLQRHYDYVLCTIPFSVLRRLELNGVSSEKMLAIRNITYASSTKVLLYCQERFWEGEKYNIVGGASISERISRQTYYPSNHVLDYRQPWPEQEEGREFQPLSLAAAYSDASCERESGTSPKEPGVLLGSYTWGMNARRLGVLSREGRAQTVINSISKFHEEIAKPGQVIGNASMFWDENKWSTGAFTHFDSSDPDWYYQAGLKPEGRLHFAGEHLSPAPGWIQGALISSLRAVLEMVKSFPTAC